jgi:precorrin-6A/cobalt-precorrin-6A reductase
MHGPDLHQGPTAARRIWLFAGTEEGPLLAESLLARGWWVQVSVVTAAAARAYARHPELQLQVGAIDSDALLQQELEQLRPRWVVDATHPFAQLISERLERLCQASATPLLRLQRQQPDKTAEGEQLRWLQGINDLQALPLAGERLLLAIGARHLKAAIAASAGAEHFARVLDQPGSLQGARAAGLNDAHIACLRPDAHTAGALEAALCRRWGISVVLCRQGGGRSEALWRQVCRRQSLPLLLLRQPPAAAGLPLPALLERLGQP